MITLIVKGVDPLDGWVYLGQKGANSGHHCTRMDCRAGRALFETVTGQRLFPRRMPSFFESFPVVLLDDLSVGRAVSAFSGGFLSNVGRKPSSSPALSLSGASAETAIRSISNPRFSGPQLHWSSRMHGSTRRKVRLNRQLSRSDETSKIVRYNSSQ